MWVNANLNKELVVRITGFPMRFIPMDDVNRRHVGAGWQWRYLRGIQGVLQATCGLVRPNPELIRTVCLRRVRFGNHLCNCSNLTKMP
jgi:hypothetical protein